MEVFLPNGEIRFEAALDYHKNQKSISPEIQEKVIAYMRDTDKLRKILIIVGEDNALYTDEQYCWFTNMINDVEKGKCQLKNKFVDHVLKKLKNRKLK